MFSLPAAAWTLAGACGAPLERDGCWYHRIQFIASVWLSQGFLGHWALYGEIEHLCFLSSVTHCLPLWGYLGSQNRWIKVLIPRPLPKACFLTHVPSAAFITRVWPVSRGSWQDLGNIHTALCYKHQVSKTLHSSILT